MGHAPKSLTEMIRGVVEPLGYELVGVEYLSRGTGGSLRRIDSEHDNGIGVKGC